MDLSGLAQNLNLGTLALICSGLCVVGVILFVVIHVGGMFFGIFSGLIEGIAHIVSGGPVAWCGCLMAILGIGACGFLGWTLVTIYSSCGSAQAVNFCRFFGR